MKGAFLSGTGTGAGKTFVTAALATHLRARGDRVVAYKPVETGVGSAGAEDALALAAACGEPAAATVPGFVRMRAPLAPYAAHLAGEPLPPAPKALATIVRDAAAHHRAEVVLVEGAGGLLVPLDAAYTVADVAVALGFPLVLVAPNRLGVLSHVLTAHAAATREGLDVAALVLTEPPATPRDASAETNGRILTERLSLPVLETAAAGWVPELTRALGL